MRFFPVKFYDDKPDGGGGAPAPDPTPAAATPPAAAEPITPFLTADQAKELGISSLDDLRQILQANKQSAITPEEKAKAENQEKGNFHKFIADQNLMNLDDLAKMDSLKSKADRDLVYEHFESDFKTDDPDATPEEIKEAFDEKYNLESERTGVKKWAEKQIAKVASEIRNPLESKYNSAKESYNQSKVIAAKSEEFFKVLGKIVEDSTPEKLVLHTEKEGDDEIPVEVDLTKKEREEIFKSFTTPRNFAKFADGKMKAEDFQKEIAAKIQSFLKVKYFDTAVSQAFEKAKKLGTKQGSNIGAQQPFAIVSKNNAKQNDSTPVVTLEQSNDKIAQAREKFASR